MVHQAASRVVAQPLGHRDRQEHPAEHSEGAGNTGWQEVVQHDRRIEERQSEQFDRRSHRLGAQEPIQQRFQQQREQAVAGPHYRHQHHGDSDVRGIGADVAEQPR